MLQVIFSCFNAKKTKQEKNYLGGKIMTKIKVYGPQGQATFEVATATELWQAIDTEVGTNDFIGYKKLPENRKFEWQQELDNIHGIETFLEDAKKRGFIDSFEIEMEPTRAQFLEKYKKFANQKLEEIHQEIVDGVSDVRFNELSKKVVRILTSQHILSAYLKYGYDSDIIVNVSVQFIYDELQHDWYFYTFCAQDRDDFAIEDINNILNEAIEKEISKVSQL
ncbi:hypothetical protein LEQ_0343 [Ligilactobacillus equi DPC 6820]|uniref:Uncharacterized protein n=2 Tax=Ligilactobacillus equi TaxID=137357 RepID=V7HZ56_9LACO|nr:hypothetical protein LEQ_0343 [Ligilactobacillus equi DPC 6820]